MCEDGYEIPGASLLEAMEELVEILDWKDRIIDEFVETHDTDEDYIEALTKELESAVRQRRERKGLVDAVNHPSHYTKYGAEVILITEHMNFCRGNAVKYLCRAGLKEGSDELEDLEKAVWYIQREISRLK